MQHSFMDSTAQSSNSTLLSFVIPCLNEAGTLASVLEDCHAGGQRLGQPYEIIVADNGSTDGSSQIAERNGARVVPVSVRGYGAALSAGINSARGKYVLMGDADSTYEFQQAPEFVAKLQQGYDLVMGNRFKGQIAKGAMPFLHQYLGNPTISALGRLFFGINFGDFYCGLRGFDRQSILLLNLNCKGMEFAIEMAIKSGLMDLKSTEIPTNLRPNPPKRSPHLKTWRDGWRTLKFMLSFAPKYNLIPLASILGIMALILITLYSTRTVPFTGSNTLVFAACCIFASSSILSDYLLAREMIYRGYSLRRSHKSFAIDKLLGLHKGTDRLFKIAASCFLLSIFAFVGLLMFAIRGMLSDPSAGMFSVIACALMLIATSFYLTASKITSYRSLHQVSQ